MSNHRLRFSIRALLATVAIVAVPLCWLVKTADRAFMRATAMREIAKSEGIVNQSGVNPWAPEWIRTAVGEEYFLDAKAVTFATNRGRKFGTDEAKATDEQLVLLESLTD